MSHLSIQSEEIGGLKALNCKFAQMLAKEARKTAFERWFDSLKGSIKEQLPTLKLAVSRICNEKTAEMKNSFDSLTNAAKSGMLNFIGSIVNSGIKDVLPCVIENPGKSAAVAGLVTFSLYNTYKVYSEMRKKTLMKKQATHIDVNRPYGG